jgi:hypothetical protein
MTIIRGRRRKQLQNERKEKDHTEILRIKKDIENSGELASEETIDLSREKLRKFIIGYLH